MGIFRKSSDAGRRPRGTRRVELSGLGAERLEGRALLSHMPHLTAAEVTTLRAERTAHFDHLVANAGTAAAGHAHPQAHHHK